MSDVLVALPTDGIYCGACPHKQLWTLMTDLVGRCALFGGHLWRPDAWPEGIDRHRAILRCTECLAAERAANRPRQLVMGL